MKQYHISPDLLRELDSLRAQMESIILNAEYFEDDDTAKAFYILRGFNEAVALITNLVHGYDENAITIKGRLLNSYEGMSIDLEFEEDEGD